MPEMLDPKHPPRLTPPARSEAAYLKQRRSDALKGLKVATGDVVGSVKEIADPTPWIKRYPYRAAGGAAAVSLVAAYLATPSRAKKLARRLATIERIMDAEAKANGIDPKRLKAGKKPRPYWQRLLIGLVVRQVKPVLLSTITGLLSGALAGQATGDDADAGPDPGDVT